MKKMLVVSVVVVMATLLLHALSFAQTEGQKIRLVFREVALGQIFFGIIINESLVVSPDSQHVAYVAVRGGKVFVVVDGVEGKEYDGIVTGGGPRFSPDSQHVAYVAGRGEKRFVVVDGVEGKEYDGTGENTLIFSPDSQRVAYEAVRGGKHFVVVDGEEGQEYDGIVGGAPRFSPDSQHVAYVAVRGGKVFVVVDGVEGKAYSVFPLRGSELVFDSPKLLHALAMDSRPALLTSVPDIWIFRVEVEIKSGGRN